MPGPTTERPRRETVTTIRSDGSRKFLFPADARGRFATLRRYSALALIGFYLLLPWVPVNGYPAAFFDLAGRRFHLFGLTFAAQDLWLMFFVITGVGFGLFFITALLGRVWCGYACPHTVFLDHVYRRIERWIDGDAVQRRALADAPLSARKVTRRVVKHSLYLLVSAGIMHLFLAYFVSLPEVWHMIRSAPTEHWGAFAFMAVSTGVLYFNFAWFREQLCIVICPYGRIQSALIDESTVVIGYDRKRGEPRGRAGTVDAGDCIDCTRCVQVCPTGIDIRQGLQMECIGCTACIDACDDVMKRVGRPQGLIRYDSQAGFAHRRTRWIRPRTILYFALLLAGAIAATVALSTVRPFNFGVTRMVGAPYIVDGGTVRNQFLVRLVNKRNAPVDFEVTLQAEEPGVRHTGFETTVRVAPLQEIVQPFILQQERKAYDGPFKFRLEAKDAAGSFKIERAVEFLGPNPLLLPKEAP